MIGKSLMVRECRQAKGRRHLCTHELIVACARQLRSSQRTDCMPVVLWRLCMLSYPRRIDAQKCVTQVRRRGRLLGSHARRARRIRRRIAVEPPRCGTIADGGGAIARCCTTMSKYTIDRGPRSPGSVAAERPLQGLLCARPMECVSMLSENVKDAVQMVTCSYAWSRHLASVLHDLRRRQA